MGDQTRAQIGRSGVPFPRLFVAASLFLLLEMGNNIQDPEPWL